MCYLIASWFAQVGPYISPEVNVPQVTGLDMAAAFALVLIVLYLSGSGALTCWAQRAIDWLDRHMPDSERRR